MINISRKLPVVILTILVCVLVLLQSACTSTVKNSTAAAPIRQSEIIAFQQGFGVSLNGISNAFINKLDYTTAARNHIEKYYGFDFNEVLFKANDSVEDPFRSTYEGILSYLIGGNDSFPDDKGFALQNLIKVNWKNAGIINDHNIAIAIGQSTYQKKDGSVVKQNYTMCFKKDVQGKLKLIAHKTALPCED